MNAEIFKSCARNYIQVKSMDYKSQVNLLHDSVKQIIYKQKMKYMQEEGEWCMVKFKLTLNHNCNKY